MENITGKKTVKKEKLEEGGVFGVYDGENAASLMYYGLYALQHRGQTSCGAVLSDNFNLLRVMDRGLVSEVIEPNLHKLKGNMGIGHVRYGDSRDALTYAQPLISNYLKGNISISMAGKLTNGETLKAQLEDKGAIFQVGSDAEILAHLFARERVKTESIESAVQGVMTVLQGAYSVLVMSSSKLLAFRDKDGLRPLCIGKKDSGYIFSSENTAFSVIGAELVRDVCPGELVLINKNGLTSFKGQAEFNQEGSSAKTCIYEYLYFARPDSVIDNVSVYNVRVNAGKKLYRACPAKADVVIGVPSAGLHYALGYAEASGIPFGDGLIRNYYLGRTTGRDESFKKSADSIKLSVIEAAVKGKKIVLVDDSMVRGVTAKRIIKLLKSGGASEVHLRIACPIFMSRCPFGAGTDSDLKNKAVDKIREEVGADSLMFLPVDQLDSIGAPKNACKICFKQSQKN